MENNVSIGATIRKYRLSNKMTMDDLAKASGITQSMLSQIERDMANPSINTLRLIADALKIPMFQFFIEDNDLDKFVVTPSTRKKLSLPENSNLVYELLTPDLRGDIQFCRMLLSKGTPSIDTDMHHQGEEVALVLKGTVDICIDNSTITLNAGDSIRIPSRTNHKWENIYDEDVEVIFAITPPSF